MRIRDLVIGWMAVTASLAPHWSCAGNGAAMEASRFEFDLASGSGSGPSKNFLSIRGGAPRFTMIDYRTGQDRDNKKTTGDVEYDDVEVVSPLVKGQTGNMEDIKTIVNSWTLGEGEAWESTLSIKDKENNTIRTVNYHGNVPVQFELPTFHASGEGLLAFRFIFKPAEVDSMEGDRDNDRKNLEPGNPVDFAAAPSDNPAPRAQASIPLRVELTLNGQGVTDLVAVDPGAVYFVPASVISQSRRLSEAFGDGEKTLRKIQEASSKLPYDRFRRGLTAVFQTWSATRRIQGGDTHWHDLYQAFKDETTGARETTSRIHGTLTYFDREFNPVLTVNFFDAAVVSYNAGEVRETEEGFDLTETLYLQVRDIELGPQT